MPYKHPIAPDNTAIRTVLWRALHVHRFRPGERPRGRLREFLTSPNLS